MIEALMLAAAPHFRLQELAFRPHRGAAASTEFGALRGDYRLVWSARSPHPSSVSENPGSSGTQEPEASRAVKAGQVASELRIGALTAAGEILAARGEPLAYSWLHHRALEQLAHDEVLARTMAAKLSARDNPFQFLRREIEAGLKEGYARDLDHWKEDDRILWVRNSRSRDVPSLADRVEEAARESLSQKGQLTNEELEDGLLERFPGLLTPEIGLVESCAAAYADERAGVWTWRAVEVEAELEQARARVAELGAHLGYRVARRRGAYEVVWRTEKVIPGSSSGAVRAEHVEEDSHVFIFRARVNLRELVRQKVAPLRGFVVIPETQVALLQHKLYRAPTWRPLLREAGWEFLRVPFVKLLLRSAVGERAEFQLAWGLEPALVQGKEQMELF
jgi:hypothetical protein